MPSRQLSVPGLVQLALLSGLALSACSSSSDTNSSATPSGSAGLGSGGGSAAGASAALGGGAAAGAANGGHANSGAGQGGNSSGASGSAGVSGTVTAGSGGATGSAGATAAGSGGATSSAGSPAGGGASNGGATNGGASSGGASGGNGGAAGGAAQTCPSPALKAGNTTRSLTIGSNKRSYVLHVPSAYAGTQTVPLILDFHGIGGDGPGEQTASTYPPVTDADGVIMAFPTGLAGPSGNAWNVGPCCVDNTDDVAFAKALVTDIESIACIDTKRVYAVGFSMGGGMSHYLGCHAADVFAAIAPAAFDLLQENVTGCTPARPISVISFRSTGDPVVPYAGGASSVVPNHPVTFLGAVNTFKKWASLNSCSGDATDVGGGCQAYGQCSAGVEVELCTKQGGGHDEGNAQVAWPILKRHTLP